MRMLLRTLVLIAVALSTATAMATFSTTLTRVETGVTTNSLVYNGAFDSWVFSVAYSRSTASTYDGIGFTFSSTTNSFLETGSTTFNTSASNPRVFGFEAPDTFFITPQGPPPALLPVVDTSGTLSVLYSPQIFNTLVPTNGVPVPVAYLSMPAGTPIGSFFSLSNVFYHSTFTVVPGQTVDERFEGLYGENPVYEGYSFSGPTPAVPPQYVPGHFIWDTTGSQVGTYTVDAHAYGTANQITINVVPEPSLIVLAALGFTMCCAFVRRRCEITVID